MSEVDATLRRIKDAREFAEKRLKTETSKEEREDAQDLKNCIDRLIKLMCDYTETVFMDNEKNYSRTQLLKRMDRSEYQSYCENLERSRKTCHDALITQVRMTDSLCDELGLKPIYGELPEQYQKDSSLLMGSENRAKPGVVETRHAIADWAWDVTIGSTVALYIDVSELDYEKNISDLEKISSAYHHIGGKKQADRMIQEMTEPEK